MSWQPLSDSQPKARKDYQCVLCGLVIPKGEVHQKWTGRDDDGIITSRAHLACFEKTRGWNEDDWLCVFDNQDEFRIHELGLAE